MVAVSVKVASIQLHSPPGNHVSTWDPCRSQPQNAFALFHGLAQHVVERALSAHGRTPFFEINLARHSHKIDLRDRSLDVPQNYTPKSSMSIVMVSSSHNPPICGRECCTGWRNALCLPRQSQAASIGAHTPSKIIRVI